MDDQSYGPRAGFLAPFDASVATETAEVNPIDERQVQRIIVMCWADFLHVVDHLVINQILAIHLDLDCFYRFEHDREIIFGSLVWRWQFTVLMQVACCPDVVTDGGVPDVASLGGLTSDQGDGVAGEEVISCLDILFREAGILTEIDVLGPTYRMICPGLVNMLLLTFIGSTDFFSNMASIVCEIMAALG